MAARINKKRAFLFVSKILGKHIPVDPHTSLLSGAALSLLLLQAMSGKGNNLVNELLNEAIEGLNRPKSAKNVYRKIQNSHLMLPIPAKFIGFAETATALGHSMYNVFNGGCTYIHTTRELIPSMQSMINFDEEHSHAVSHRCYAEDRHVLAGEEAIVLVDDEITTGNTVLNIIKDLHSKFPRKNYMIASLLDWRTPEDEQRYVDLENQLGITITSLSLIKGIIQVEGNTITSVIPEKVSVSHSSASIEFIYLNDLFAMTERESESSTGFVNTSPYLTGTGRFGIHMMDNRKTDQSVDSAAKCLSTYRKGMKTLCLGTGEFMYLPMRISAEMGEGVRYHSTTRSPIHSVQLKDYAISHAISFPSPDDAGVTNFVYNIAPGQYDDVFLFLERDLPLSSIKPMIESFDSKGFKQINIVICGPNRHPRMVIVDECYDQKTRTNG